MGMVLTLDRGGNSHFIWLGILFCHSYSEQADFILVSFYEDVKYILGAWNLTQAEPGKEIGTSNISKSSHYSLSQLFLLYSYFGNYIAILKLFVG